MKTGIMQPYFFPYLGHFELVYKTDLWAVFDIVKYSRKTWMNRNRIMHPSKGWQYFNVPVTLPDGKHNICDAVLTDRLACEKKLLGQIQHYRGKAPFFHQVCQIIEETFTQTRTGSLVHLNVNSLKSVCGYLNIDFQYSICSEQDWGLMGVEHAGQWALEIASHLGGSHYINPRDGKDLFKPEEWQQRGMQLSILKDTPLQYNCGDYDFVERLSVLDVLMWCHPEEVMAHLDSHTEILHIV